MMANVGNKFCSWSCVAFVNYETFANNVATSFCRHRAGRFSIGFFFLYFVKYVRRTENNGICRAFSLF